MYQIIIFGWTSQEEDNLSIVVVPMHMSSIRRFQCTSNTTHSGREAHSVLDVNYLLVKYSLCVLSPLTLYSLPTPPSRPDAW